MTGNKANIPKKDDQKYLWEAQTIPAMKLKLEMFGLILCKLLCILKLQLAKLDNQQQRKHK